MLQPIQRTDADVILNAVRQSAALQGISFAEMLKRLEGIDKKLEKRIAYWKTQDAIQAYKENAFARHACPENHTRWMREFELLFKDKNIAEISPMEIEGFLFAGWGNCERSTWNVMKARVSGFYSYVIKELKRKGSPSFHNPCILIDDMKNVKSKKHEFVRIDKMRELLDTFTTPHHWLWYHILLTAGLRISELTELRPMDVAGRVLTLGGGKPTKSGRPFGEEQAVIPHVVADKLKVYMKGLRDDERIFKTSHSNAFVVLKTHCKQIKADEMSPHDLRRWVATYYDRLAEYQMRRFVLRHSSITVEGVEVLSPLEGRYVASLSPAEASEKQDRTLTRELFGGG